MVVLSPVSWTACFLSCDLALAYTLGPFLYVRNNSQWAALRRQKENAHAESPATSRHGDQPGELRKIYGADFAEGCADNEKIADMLRKLPSLRKVIREREAR